jgi:S-disulfanyl-L-cysteine oxidoreductase SoxD
MFSFLKNAGLHKKDHGRHGNFTEDTKMKAVSHFFFSSPYSSSFSATSVQLSWLPCSLFALLIFFAIPATAQTRFEGIGRVATPAEVKAWDIDVRPDFKGLPPGKGSVAQGEKIWEEQCAACHGSFGESNEVFTPIAGGTTAKDVQAGRVAGLQLGANTPQRTTLMKLSSLSTLWDYVNRAMPWTAPKSLKPDEVYAVTAYMLNLGNIVPADFTLSKDNIRETQNLLPNRNGKTTAHAMWPGRELGGQAKPDVQGSACMKDCKAEPSVASFLPDYARNAHGNLAEQSRSFGPQRGANTTRTTTTASAADTSVLKPNQPLAGVSPAQIAINSVANDVQFAASGAAKPAALAATSAATSAAAPASFKLADVNPLLQKYACAACHGVDNKIVGPSFKEIVAKQSKRSDAQAYLQGKIKGGGQGVYGQIPMPAQSLSDAEAAKIAQWLVQGAAK